MLRPRPPKASGVASYQQAVANGVTDIIDADLDIDADTLYDLVNGRLDDANINADLSGPKIDYRKLALAGKVQVTDLAGVPLAAPSLIAPQSITTALLAIGATVAGIGIQASGTVNVAGPEIILVEQTWVSRGGPYRLLCLGVASGVLQSGPGTTRALCQFRVGGTAGALDGTPLGAMLVEVNAAGSAPTTIVSATMAVGELTPLAPGAHPIKWTAQLTQGAGVSEFLAYTNQVLAVELA
jgi:hypothetical protein